VYRLLLALQLLTSTFFTCAVVLHGSLVHLLCRSGHGIKFVLLRAQDI
jgi:hypothetical protein